MNSNVKWRRSSFCNADGCVEVAEVATGIGVQYWLRDGKLGATSPVLRFTEDEWRDFHAGMLASSGGFVPVGAP